MSDVYIAVNLTRDRGIGNNQAISDISNVFEDRDAAISYIRMDLSSVVHGQCRDEYGPCGALCSPDNWRIHIPDNDQPIELSVMYDSGRQSIVGVVLTRRIIR